MKRAHESQVNQVTTKLSEHLLHGKEDLRYVLQAPLVPPLRRHDPVCCLPAISTPLG